LGEDERSVARELLRKKISEERGTMSGPLHYDDRGWR
jgi:hypothetical protein